MIPTTVCLVACLVGAEPSADLTGKVVNADGAPLAAARVFIYTARPRMGTSPLCPSCYPDCTKDTATDEGGRFTIPDLDGALLFRVLAFAEGFRPQLTEHIDPSAGSLVIRLERLPAGLEPQQMLRGRVVDHKGRPIVGATVSPHGTKTVTRRWWGRMPGVDPVAVTNERGEFVITTEEPKLGFDLRIASRDHASRNVPLLETGKKIHEIRLGEGAYITGRLMKDGRPVAWAVMGLVQCKRAMTTFVGRYEIGTGDRGHFEFLHVHPNDEYYVYTKMDSTGLLGTLELHKIEVGDHGVAVELGDLSLGPSHAVSGRVILTDGQPVPAGTRLLISRRGAWDSQSVVLGPDGSFAAQGLPREVMSFVVRVPGYQLATDRNRYQQLQPSSLAVPIEDDLSGIAIYLEPKRTAGR